MKQDILDDPQINHNVSVVRIDRSGWCSIETIHHANPFLKSEGLTLTDLWNKQSESFQSLIVNTHLLIMMVELGYGEDFSIIENIVEMSKKSSTVVMGVTTLPFGFEGRKRKESAKQDLPVLKEILGSLIVIEKDSYLPEMDPTLKIPEAFKFIDNVVNSVVFDISDIVTNTHDDDIALDINELSTMMETGGLSRVSIAEAQGTNACLEVVQKALHAQTLSSLFLQKSSGMLVLFRMNQQYPYWEIKSAMDTLYSLVSEDTQMIFATKTDDQWPIDYMKITVIATDTKVVNNDI